MYSGKIAVPPGDGGLITSKKQSYNCWSKKHIPRQGCFTELSYSSNSTEIENIIKQTLHIPGVEWILVHKHFMCKNKNSRILAPLIILEQTLKYKSCRVLKMVPSSYLFYFLTSSGSTQ
jgi:hypothetical protein